MIDDEVRLARAARVAGIGILEWDLATGRIAWSEGALALWGLVPGNRPRDSEALLAAVHAADRARFGAALAAARGSGSAFELDLRIGQEDPPARWLNLRAAIDRDGAHAARDSISLIKFHVAKVLQDVLDRAIQVHGAMGMTDETPLAFWYRHERAARIYDGPDEVHKRAVARRILGRYA